MKKGVVLKKWIACFLCMLLVIGVLMQGNSSMHMEVAYARNQTQDQSEEQKNPEWQTQLNNQQEGLHVSKGFHANIFKYNADTKYQLDYKKVGCNLLTMEQAKQVNKTPLLFSKGGCNVTQVNRNHYEGVYQGIADENLTNGKITFSNYAVQNLFYGTEGDGVVKKAYRNVDFPLSKDENGVYEYDSMDKIIRIKQTNGTYQAEFQKYKDNVSKKSRGFWPFGTDETGFGMEFGMEFYTTKDGKLSNVEGSPSMVFDFSGDDDVWVYIDGKKVIDLGGIHPAVGAKIDFSKGTVQYYTVQGKGATGTVYHSVQGSQYSLYDSLFKKNKLLDGRKHTLQMFYLERGGYESNCKLHFNLPQEPQEDAIYVSNTVKKVWKDLETNTQEEWKDDTAFMYQITKNGKPMAGQKYALQDGTEKVTDENGCFQLKNAQKAGFLQLENGTYQVLEKINKKYTGSYTGKSIVEGNKYDSWVDSSTKTYIGATIQIDSPTENPQTHTIDFVNKRMAEGGITLQKHAYLKDWQKRTYRICLEAEQYCTDEEFYQKTEGTVIDYVDERFVLLNQNGEQAKVGEKVTKAGNGIAQWDNKKGIYYVVWKSAKIPYKDTDTKSWKGEILVQARDSYAGGNCITTNTNESKVSLNERERFFPMPKVNVRTKWKCVDEQDTIFLGETLESYFTTEKEKKIDGTKHSVDQRDVTCMFEWEGPNGKIKTNNPTKVIRESAPEKTEKYEVYVTVTPNKPDDSKEAQRTAQQMQEDKSDNTIYTASVQSKEDAVNHPKKVKANGQYLVQVVAGELTIQKKFDTSYLKNIPYTKEEKDAVASNQSAVFTITRFSPEDRNCTQPLETYQAVLSEDDEKNKEGFSSVKLVALRKGYYQVKEQTDWSWKYDCKSLKDTYQTETDGIFFIGEKGAYEELDHFFGQQGAEKDAKAVVKFENELKREKKWLGDTTHKNNQFQ